MNDLEGEREIISFKEVKKRKLLKPADGGNDPY